VARPLALQLQRRQIFATRRRKGASAPQRARLLLDIQPRESAAFDMQLNSLLLPGLCFTCLQYGDPGFIRLR